MTDSEKMTRSDAVDMVLEAGISKSRQVLATLAMHNEGPPFTRGKHGVEYKPAEVKAWIEEKLKAKKGD
jgi:hypothetical protein